MLYFGEGVILLSLCVDGLLHASGMLVWTEQSTYRILEAQTVKSVITDCLLKNKQTDRQTHKKAAIAFRSI